jgi:lipopolysaccharide/colanic/teichoic acid biosynthesis glycosyltransferase
MTADAEKETGAVWAQENDPRITKVGRVIRKLRIDEIPQMWNVLRGDMSFVGPRPERPEFVEELKVLLPFYQERMNIKPGITGYAQVCREYGASIEDALEKLQYDLYYIKNMNLLFDLRIVFETVKIIVLGRGAR